MYAGQLIPILKDVMFGGVGESQFLVSHIKLHKLVSPSTVSRRLGQVLAIAGIDTEVFKAHSTRSASSSKAEVTGSP